MSDPCAKPRYSDMSSNPVAHDGSGAAGPHVGPALGSVEIFLARQPLLDRQGGLVAYELLFRGDRTDRAEISSDFQASSTVVHHTLAGIGIETVLGKVQGYLNVDREFLLSNLIELLSPRQIVLEILETVSPTPDVLARMVELRTRGFRLALDDFVGFGPGVESLLERVDIVKIDLLRVPVESLPVMVARLHRWPVTLLAEKVESPAQFRLARDLGFELFQGYYFARPELLTARQHPNPEKVHLLRLLALIMADSDILALEAEFRRHPMLAFNLLRMVNSAALGLRTRIDSLRHALVLFGRRSLQNWMQLALYSNTGSGGGSTPLLQMAAVRGKLMESLMQAETQADQPDLDAAFLTGILSLLEALFEMPQETVLENLYVSEEVRLALLERGGRLGRLLALAELLERDDPKALRYQLLAMPHLSVSSLLQMQIDAFAWANAVEIDFSR